MLSKIDLMRYKLKQREQILEDKDKEQLKVYQSRYLVQQVTEEKRNKLREEIQRKKEEKREIEIQTFKDAIENKKNELQEKLELR